MASPFTSISPIRFGHKTAETPLMDGAGNLDTPVVVVNLDEEIDRATAEVAAARIIDDGRRSIGLRTRSVPLSEAQLIVAAALDTSFVPETIAAHRALVGASDPVSECSRVLTVFEFEPQAASILGQVLRISEDLSVNDAIDVESFAYSTLLGAPGFRRWLDARGTRVNGAPAHREPTSIRRESNTLLITLSNPERRNAYSAQTRDSLVNALRLALIDNTIKRIYLNAAGPVFSAGGDLDEFGVTPDLATAHFVRTREGAGRLVGELADRMDVRVHGACIGAGIEIPAFASRITAAPDTVFRLPEVSMGLIPGAGGCVSIPRRIGRWRAFWLCVTGAVLDAQTAVAWGLIDEIERPAHDLGENAVHHA